MYSESTAPAGAAVRHTALSTGSGASCERSDRVHQRVELTLEEMIGAVDDVQLGSRTLRDGAHPIEAAPGVAIAVDDERRLVECFQVAEIEHVCRQADAHEP